MINMMFNILLFFSLELNPGRPSNQKYETASTSDTTEDAQ